MSGHKSINIISVFAIVIAVLLSVFIGLWKITATETDSALFFSEYFSAENFNTDLNTANSLKIDLNKNNGEDVLIGTAGNYVISGSGNCSVRVEASKNDLVHLYLNDVNLKSETDAALFVGNAGKVIITLIDGTENFIERGTGTTLDENIDGAIYSKDDITINGSGTLNVSSDTCHGIDANDNLFLTGGTVNVTAAGDAIHANDSVRINSCNLTIDAGDDGITVSNDDKNGFFFMESGNVTIGKCYEGIEADTITFVGGSANIISNDDGLNAYSLIDIQGGEICVLNSEGRDADGFDSNGDIIISGGRVFISINGENNTNTALDYGSENGGSLLINGGYVAAFGGGGMFESVSENSVQGFVTYVGSSSKSGQVELLGASGNTLILEEVPYTFSSAILSTEGITNGDTCIFTADGESVELTAGENPTGAGGFRGGALRTFGETGSFGEPGGTEPPEGMEPPDGFGGPGGTEPPGGFGGQGGMEPPGGFGGQERPEEPNGFGNRQPNMENPPEDNGEKVGNAENEPRDIPQNPGRPDFRENTDINSQATPQVESNQETNRIPPEFNSDRAGADGSEFGQFRDNQKRRLDEENTASGDNSVIVFWVVISAAALALGLIIAKLFRR